MRRQQGMRLDDRDVPYLQMAGLYHLARLNDRWFWLDEALVSTFVERWRPETHTFHMPFGECTITLQDMAYQLGLPVDRRYVSGCLSEFHIYIQGGRPAWVWFQELLGVIPPPSQVQKYAVNCSWFQETFGEFPEGADEEIVRRYARAYIMMLLGTQLFEDKSRNCIHIRWLPYGARLEEMGTYSWGSAALAWLYRCMCRVTNRAGSLQLLQSWIFWRFPRFRPPGYETFNWPLASRWSGYNPSGSEKGPRVQMWRLRIDRLQDREFIWMPYSSPDVLQWHQIDRVLPQFGGVQPCPHPALDIDFLMSKDGRGSDRWFPFYLQKWHLLWDSCAESVLRFDVVADPEPSHEFLEWWSQHGKRFLSPETHLRDLRTVPIPVEASQRGPGRVPDMDRPEDVPDRWRVERRMGVGTRRSQREWRWPDHAMNDDYDAGPVRGGRRRQGGAVAAAGASTHHAGQGWSDFLGSDTLDADFGSPCFLEEITAIMQGDVTPRRGGQTSGTQAPLDVDLNEPPSSAAADHFSLGGTPASAFTAASESVAGPSAAALHVAPPAQPAPHDDRDDIEDEEPFIRRGQRARVARRCGTGSHLFR
ncbi:hypothetical protein Ahy_A05g023053 [Arachis hypogaea]|uniref:Aminotransferase-like plant mobile domain-containing protein n=1 Tax=Arachis hypogaea TaxID=3818 RepID=A0A445D2D9_ARAHY|nr:hypothetical protein Ahy_A05g023053 [Arachis hypogaea]